MAMARKTSKVGPIRRTPSKVMRLHKNPYNYAYKIMIVNVDILLFFGVFKHIRDQFLYSMYILMNPILPLSLIPFLFILIPALQPNYLFNMNWDSLDPLLDPLLGHLLL
jgi:hypothetical protein